MRCDVVGQSMDLLEPDQPLSHGDPGSRAKRLFGRPIPCGGRPAAIGIHRLDDSIGLWSRAASPWSSGIDDGGFSRKSAGQKTQR